MPRYAFDIETDGLLLECTKMHILVACDLDTGTRFEYLEGDLGWQALFNKATLVVGHNILGFDIYALQKLFNYNFPESCKFHDTLLMSQILDYKRFDTLGHSLAVWGEALGYPKGDHSDWTVFSEDMRGYCHQDVTISVKAYKSLLTEYRALAAKAPNIKHYMQSEHYAARWVTEARLHGWPFDVEGAKALQVELEATVSKVRGLLESQLGTKVVAVDKAKGEYPHKVPKWLKNGAYDFHTANWFGIDQWAGVDDEYRLVIGPYSRIVFEDLKLSSVADVKIFLYRNGWVPTEWNTKKEGFKKIKTSPKITEDSLELLGGDGKLYTEYLSASSRLSIVKTWLENTDRDENLHGDCMLVGTPSMRARHSIIVNVPSADAAWGPEMRKLFKCKPGWKLIGCDSAGNQARGLAHYLNDAEYIDTLLNGDIHQYNADILTEIILKMAAKKSSRLKLPHDFKVPRGRAKRVLYAFLFGAAGGLLWSYIFDVVDDESGKVLKREFIKAVPGFKELTEKLERVLGATNQTGNGYIPSIAGNKLYVDSFHKLLVYLLQGCEKITCSAALMVAVKEFKARGIPYIPCIYYHDEIDFMVPEEYAEEAAAIGKLAFKTGPELYGITIMDGDAKIGNNWLEVH